MDKPQYSSIPLEELRRIEADIERAGSVNDLRLLFDRLNAIRRHYIDNFDVQLAVADVHQEIVDRGRSLQDAAPTEIRYTAPPPPPPPARETADVFLREGPAEQDPQAEHYHAEAEIGHADADLPPDVKRLDARSWKRATYIGAFFAIILFAAFFYLVQTARRLNIDTDKPASTPPARTATNQQKPNPATPVAATPPSTNPTLRLYTDLEPGTVSIDGGEAKALQDGELQLDTLQAGQHSVKLTGRTGSATVDFTSADKASPTLTARPIGENAMIIAVSTQDGRGRLMTNTQNAVALLDGKELGPIPSSGLELTALGDTDHDLQIRQGNDSQRFVLTHVPAPALTIFVKNDLNAGNLVILTGEDGADVFINDQKYKRRTDHGQLRVPGLKVGTYTIRVAKNGFLDVPAQKIDVKKGEDAKIVFHLQQQPPQPAVLAVTGAPPGTQIFVDGNLAATAAADGSAKAPGLSTGYHRIELKHSGFQTKELDRAFTAGETVTLAGSDVELAKVPVETPAPAPPPATPAPAEESSPAESTNQTNPSNIPASIHRGGGFLIYHTTKEPGHYTFTMQLRKGGGFLKSKRLQWFLGYQDTKNYLLFQVDGKHFVVRQVIDGKGEDLQKAPFDIDPEGYVQIDLGVKAHAVDTRLRPADGAWRDMGTVTGTSMDLTQGKFGVLISGNNEIGVSPVHFGK